MNIKDVRNIGSSRFRRENPQVGEIPITLLEEAAKALDNGAQFIEFVNGELFVGDGLFVYKFLNDSNSFELWGM